MLGKILVKRIYFIDYRHITKMLSFTFVSISWDTKKMRCFGEVCGPANEEKIIHSRLILRAVAKIRDATYGTRVLYDRLLLCRYVLRNVRATCMTTLRHVVKRRNVLKRWSFPQKAKK